MPYKTLRVSERTHKEIMDLADARGMSVDSLLNRYFLPRFTKWGSWKVGHCIYCHKPLHFTWEELDEAINKGRWYHAKCKEAQEEQ